MEKSFIERLTDEQVIAFLERAHPKQGKYSYNLSRNEGFIYVLMKENFGNSSFNFSLYDYDTIGCNRHTLWIKYLYEVFGEEYKQSYLDYCAKIFN